VLRLTTCRPTSTTVNFTMALARNGDKHMCKAWTVPILYNSLFDAEKIDSAEVERLLPLKRKQLSGDSRNQRDICMLLTCILACVL
jgi:hypothetical protein